MDYDADGDLDVLSGSYTGEVYWFECLGERRFAQGRFLLDADGEPLRCGTSIAPEAIDMDDDGDLDLVIGTRLDGVEVFENTGSRTAPIWPGTGRSLFTVDGERIMGSNAHRADWDGDGIRDLLLGSESGGAVWHRNVGTEAAPRFAAAQTLVPQSRSYGSPVGQLPPEPGHRTKLHVTDWNHDGRPDLLLGDVLWMEKTRPPLTAEEQAEKDALTPEYEAAKAARTKALERQSAYLDRGEPIPDDVRAAAEAARDAYDALSARMAEFRLERTESHGMVWLYLRRAPDAKPRNAERGD